MGSQGKASAFGWARAEKGSWLSQPPHFQFKEIMKRRKRQQERLGPGTYNIRDFLQETRPSSLQGICDTREQRFRDARRDCFPGPGTYGPRGNPYARLEERDKRSAGTRGLMDSRTAKCAPLAAEGSGPGPGTYRLRSSIDEGLRRRAGGLGPCQPFSGDRSKLAGCRQRAGERRRGTELSAGTVKGFVDKLTLKENKKKGCFSTLPRNPLSCQIKAENVLPAPGASRILPESHILLLESQFFLQQHQQHVAEPVQNPVGVGRCDITEREKYPQKMRYQSLYRCDAQRYLSNLKQDAYLLERLKPVAKKTRSDMISASRCPDTSEEMFSKRKMVLESPNQ
ncbi:ciliary microtubule-associated protein 2 [Buteo buteo]|uniref:ciliary microtubule-associated protein 2 n=1 Tax=Buteo buteo TaxID=30397 RepID=UPI003EBF44FA